MSWVAAFFWVEVCLLSIGQRPQRVELDIDLRHLVHLSGVESGLEDDREQIPQIAPQHSLLDALDVVVVVLHRGVVGGGHSANSLTKQDRLRDARDGRQHIAACRYDVRDAVELERLKVVVLAVCVDDEAVQHTTRHVDDLKTAEHLILALFRSQE